MNEFLSLVDHGVAYAVSRMVLSPGKVAKTNLQLGRGKNVLLVFGNSLKRLLVKVEALIIDKGA